MSLVDIVNVTITAPRAMSGSGYPCCARCRGPLRIRYDSWSRPTIVAYRAQDIQIHWLTGERLHVETLPGLFHRECATAELAELSPGFRIWQAASDAFAEYIGRATGKEPT